MMCRSEHSERFSRDGRVHNRNHTFAVGFLSRGSGGLEFAKKLKITTQTFQFHIVNETLII